MNNSVVVLCSRKAQRVDVVSLKCSEESRLPMLNCCLPSLVLAIAMTKIQVSKHVLQVYQFMSPGPFEPLRQGWGLCELLPSLTYDTLGISHSPPPTTQNKHIEHFHLRWIDSLYMFALLATEKWNLAWWKFCIEVVTAWKFCDWFAEMNSPSLFDILSVARSAFFHSHREISSTLLLNLSLHPLSHCLPFTVC
jgi:hypothetical protein